MKFLTRFLFMMPMCIWLQATFAAQPLTDRLERHSRPVQQAERSQLTAAQKVNGSLVMAGEGGRVLIRNENGQLHQGKVPVDLLLTAMHFVDDRHGWVVGHDGVILYSNDSGESWSKQLDGRAIGPLMLSEAQVRVERLKVAIAKQPNDEALNTALDDALFSLDDIKAGIEHGPSRPLLDVWFRDTDNGWAVGAFGVVLRTRDGGHSWTYVPGLDNPDRLHLNSVLGLMDGSVLVVGEGGRLYRSRDDGEHWQAAQVLTNASLYKLLLLRDGRLLAMGFGGNLFVSGDHGDTWQRLAVPAHVSLYGGTQISDGSVLLAGQSGIVLNSADDLLFHAWQSPTKSPWLAISELGESDVALVGSSGLVLVPKRKIEDAKP